MKVQPVNESDEGEHFVQIEVSLANTPTVKEISTITIEINPCQVINFEGTVTPAATSYTIDSDELKSFLYLFTQTPTCGYSETIEVVGLPSFMTHNSDTTDFSIFSDKLSDEGKYEVTVISTIEVPEDYSRGTTKTLTAQVDFTVTVGAVCGSTSFIEWGLHEKLFMSTVKGKTITDKMGPV